MPDLSDEELNIELPSIFGPSPNLNLNPLPLPPLTIPNKLE
jgi:hypothetical protein